LDSFQTSVVARWSVSSPFEALDYDMDHYMEVHAGLR
jgi:hypothetical protein